MNKVNTSVEAGKVNWLSGVTDRQLHPHEGTITPHNDADGLHGE